MKKGFTLVELAIVLVIIGLLIGGILVAQSMLSTSKITATVAQIQQFDAGVESFKAKFNYLPGDAPIFGGNGDGMLDNAGVSTPSGCSDYYGEMPNFWNQFDPSNYTAIAYATATPAYTSGANKNVPLAKIGDPGAFFVASAMSTGYDADTSNPRNFYAILHKTQLQTQIQNWWRLGKTVLGGVNFSSAVTPSALLALDTKMDDGSGTTGNVLSGEISGSNGSAGAILATSLTTCSNNTTGAYVVTTKTTDCTPLIRIGAAAGDPQ